MLKRDEIANPNSCLNKAADDEPVFVLRGRDALAPEIVRDWANRAEANGASADKVDEARALADKMHAWPARRMPD
jgi:hypothetical protein